MTENNPFYCKWCKKPIDGKGWTDGPAKYCNHRCWSAQSIWPSLIASLILVPFAVFILVFPEFMVHIFYLTSEDPILFISESAVAFVIVMGFFVAIFISTVFFCYTFYVGVKERRNVEEYDDTQRPHTTYFD